MNPRQGTARAQEPATQATREPGKSGIVHVIVFSNFEGRSQDPALAIQWFEACSLAHPSIKWTHMYNPWHLIIKRPEVAATEAGFSPYLLQAQANGNAEIGLHVHMYYDLIRQTGVQPRAFPFAGDTSADCNSPRRIEDDRDQGYDVLMTGYSPAERAAILDVSIGAFLARGFGRPKSFCAGYSAADPELQALLARKGFTTSFAAQVVAPNQYGSCWNRLTNWADKITPLTIPYRVSRESVLPPPAKSEHFLDLVEVPLNMGVDAYDLHFDHRVVSRSAMFDHHYDWARDSGYETSVAIGMHADVVGREMWGQGPISLVIDGFLKHVAQRAKEGTAKVKYAAVSEVAHRFWKNTTIGHVPLKS